MMARILFCLCFAGIMFLSAWVGFSLGYNLMGIMVLIVGFVFLISGLLQLRFYKELSQLEKKRRTPKFKIDELRKRDDWYRVVEKEKQK